METAELHTFITVNVDHRFRQNRSYKIRLHIKLDRRAKLLSLTTICTICRVSERLRILRISASHLYGSFLITTSLTSLTKLHWFLQDLAEYLKFLHLSGVAACVPEGGNITFTIYAVAKWSRLSKRGNLEVEFNPSLSSYRLFRISLPSSWPTMWCFQPRHNGRWCQGKDLQMGCG